MASRDLATRMEREDDGNAVIYAEGDIDVDTSRSLQDALAEALEESDSVIVDLGVVGFVDSSVLSALVWGNRKANQAGGSLRVRRPSPIVRRVLGITGLDALFLIDAETAPPSASER
jgi:anti-anti-sigma factor